MCRVFPEHWFLLYKYQINSLLSRRLLATDAFVSVNFKINHKKLANVKLIKMKVGLKPNKPLFASHRLLSEILQPSTYKNKNTWPAFCPLCLHSCEMAHYQQTNQLALLSEHPLVIIRDSTDSPQTGSTALPTCLKPWETSVQDESSSD